MAPLICMITGCTSGFGEAFVHDALSRGDKVIATGRKSETRLVHLKEAGASILELDVTASPAELDAKVKEAIAIYGHIDVLVNNAGYVQTGLIEATTQEKLMEQLDVNLFGPINMTKALLPHLRERKTGTIIFIGSLFSWYGRPNVGPYAISKHALAGFAETLNLEVSQFGIKVLHFDVGHFRTPVLAQAKSRVALKDIDDYAPMINVIAAISPSMHENQPGDPRLGIARMVDMIKGEGMAEGKEIPWRVPIGTDAVEIIKERCEETLRLIEQWKEFSRSTDFPGPKQGFWAEEEKKKASLAKQ
ncbi:NAD(P)-binding protein [Hyaloscypha hepaticicola]|uniref:NAD(P)-binding protein n=1 Tax=Hyaloscypha hepaticicola TaxID=2082293 RepID=A0A2J6QHJ6_9HELO|nr:NAD(P)-binding protein [Hyaloscypha hepaticicola]